MIQIKKVTIDTTRNVCSCASVKSPKEEEEEGDNAEDGVAVVVVVVVKKKEELLWLFDVAFKPNIQRSIPVIISTGSSMSPTAMM